MSRYGFLYIDHVWGMLSFLNWWVSVFHQYWKFLSHMFSNIASDPFFLSSPGIPLHVYYSVWVSLTFGHSLSFWFCFSLWFSLISYYWFAFEFINPTFYVQFILKPTQWILRSRNYIFSIIKYPFVLFHRFWFFEILYHFYFLKHVRHTHCVVLYYNFIILILCGFVFMFWLLITFFTSFNV